VRHYTPSSINLLFLPPNFWREQKTIQKNWPTMLKSKQQEVTGKITSIDTAHSAPKPTPPPPPHAHGKAAAHSKITTQKKPTSSASTSAQRSKSTSAASKPSSAVAGKKPQSSENTKPAFEPPKRLSRQRLDPNKVSNPFSDKKKHKTYVTHA